MTATAEQTKAELFKMPRQELVEMAGEFDPPIEIKDSWNKRTIINKILRVQRLNNPQQQPIEQEQQPVNQAGFADAVNDLNEPPTEPEVDGRGGPRPGAGRPDGSTEKEIALRIKTADENVREMVRLAVSTVNPSIEFTNEELDVVAVPYSKLYRYYVPESIRESIWAAWAEAAFGTMMLYRVIKAKDAEKVQQPKPSDPANLHGGYGMN